MTPGAYIRLRREAAGLSIEEVALRVTTDPGRSTRDRAEWIASLEADATIFTDDVVASLHRVFAFDRKVLVQLIAVQWGVETGLPDVCTNCGCSWNDPCVAERGASCAWQDADRSLCTACAGPSPIDVIALPDRRAAHDA